MSARVRAHTDSLAYTWPQEGCRSFLSPETEQVSGTQDSGKGVAEGAGSGAGPRTVGLSLGVGGKLGEGGRGGSTESAAEP